MIDVKDFGLNKICPVCGEEIRIIDVHTNSLDGVYRINGRCIYCDSLFEVSQTGYKDEDIKSKWNKIFKKGEGVSYDG